MVNAEKYKKQIAELHYDFGVNAKTGEPIYCDATSSCCRKCMFDNTDRSCYIDLCEWLTKEEGEELIMLSDREKAFIQYAEQGWLVRNPQGRLFYFKPNAKPEIITVSGQYVIATKCEQKPIEVAEELFQFVKWPTKNNPYKL